MNVTSVTIPVDGMACDSCAVRIKRTLVGMNGVIEADVNFDTRSAVIKYDAHTLEPAHLASAITGLGFETGSGAAVKAKRTASKAGGVLGPIGGMLAVLVPKGICPLCLSASSSVLPALGLSFLADSSIMRWVLAALLLVSLYAFFISARAKERWHVFAVASAGAVLVYVGWLLTSSVTLYAGTGVMLTASILNLKKPRDESQHPLDYRKVTP